MASTLGNLNIAKVFMKVLEFSISNGTLTEQYFISIDSLEILLPVVFNFLFANLILSSLKIYFSGILKGILIKDNINFP